MAISFIDYANNKDKPKPLMVFVCSAHGSSNGSHGYGDVGETPAGDCTSNIEWEVNYKDFPPQIESLLVNELYQSNDNSFRSYHECQVSRSIWVYILDPQKIETIKKLIPDKCGFDDFNDYEYHKDRMKKFVSFNAALKECCVTKIGPIEPPEGFEIPALPAPIKNVQGTSQEFWNKAINKAEIKGKEYDGD